TLRFEIDAGGEAIELMAARLRSAQLSDHGGEIAGGPGRSLDRLLSVTLVLNLVGGGVGGIRIRLRQLRLTLRVKEIRDGNLWKRPLGDRSHALARSAGLGRRNRSTSKHCNHQQCGTKRSQDTCRIRAVNQSNGRPRYSANTTASVLLIPRLAWHCPRIIRGKCPPLLLLSRVSPRWIDGSTRSGRFSDVPFWVHDIQFDCPHILVEPCPLSEEISQIGGTRRFGRADPLPAVLAAN